jgi:alpha-ketoglutarate-dependent taurine dioxygenase
MTASMFELRDQGWLYLDGACKTEMLHATASQFGTVVLAPTGEAVRQLVPIDALAAKPRSLSSGHGRGKLPFHTDTAFWPTPARLVVLHATGDLRRSTYLLSWKSVLDSLAPNQVQDLRGSVWLASIPPSTNFYATSIFNVSRQKACRYDTNVLEPVNESAERTMQAVQVAISKLTPIEIRWTPNSCLVINNWTTLHSRGDEPKDEQQRIIYRVYVR